MSEWLSIFSRERIKYDTFDPYEEKKYKTKFCLAIHYLKKLYPQIPNMVQSVACYMYTKLRQTTTTHHHQSTQPQHHGTASRNYKTTQHTEGGVRNKICSYFVSVRQLENCRTPPPPLVSILQKVRKCSG